MYKYMEVPFIYIGTCFCLLFRQDDAVCTRQKINMHKVAASKAACHAKIRDSKLGSEFFHLFYGPTSAFTEFVCSRVQKLLLLSVPCKRLTYFWPMMGLIDNLHYFLNLFFLSLGGVIIPKIMKGI